MDATVMIGCEGVSIRVVSEIGVDVTQ